MAPSRIRIILLLSLSVLPLSAFQHIHTPCRSSTCRFIRDNVVLTAASDAIDDEGYAPQENDAVTQVSQMKAVAERTRLEARRDELRLTVDRLSKLEAKAARIDSNPKHREDIMRDIALLSARLSPSVRNEAESKEKALENKVELSESPLEPTSEPTQQLLGQEKRKEAIEAFSKLPQPLQAAMAKSVGMERSANINATAVIDKLMFDNLLLQTNDTFTFQTTLNKNDLDDQAFAELFVDQKFTKLNNFVQSLFPEVTRKEALDEACVTAFCSEILGRATFNPTGKPEAVPGGYIIRGSNKASKDDMNGDLLIQAIDKRLSYSSVYKKIQCYYLLDPTPLNDDAMDFDEEDEAVLLLTNYDVSPSTGLWVKPVVSILGLSSLTAFALGAFSMNTDVVDQVFKAAENGEDLSWLVDLSMPIAGGVLCTQLAHEIGHWIVALKDGVSLISCRSW